MKKVFVHRYKWSHQKLRAKYRKLQKQGRVKRVSENKDGWLYQAVEVES